MKPDAVQFLTPQFVITVLLLALVGFVVGMVFFGNPPASNDVQVMVITAVVVTGLQEIRKFWLNSTADSEAKNSTIAQQARTAAAQTDALLDPNVVVTNTGDGKPRARAVLDGAMAPTAPAGGLQVDTLNVSALNASLSEVDPKKDR